MRASLRVLCSETMFANKARYPSLKQGCSAANLQTSVAVVPESLTARERALVFKSSMDNMLVPSGNWQKINDQNRAKYMAHLFFSTIAFAGTIYLFKSFTFVVKPDLTMPVNIQDVYKARMANVAEGDEGDEGDEGASEEE